MLFTSEDGRSLIYRLRNAAAKQIRIHPLKRGNFSFHTDHLEILSERQAEKPREEYAVIIVGKKESI